MFGSKEHAICSDHNALVNSHYMDLHDVEVFPMSEPLPTHHTNVFFHLRSDSQETTHTVMLNASHVLDAAEVIADHAGLSTHERDLIKTSLRLLDRRAREEANRSEIETN